MSKHILLATATRNGHVERSHWGSVAITDAQGSLLAWAGDPDVYAFSRSTIKPFQAIPFVRDRGPSNFGFSTSEVALLCGSHSGEDTHVAAVSSMLSKIGLLERDLRCGVHLPIQYGEDNLPPGGSRFDQRHNNCSGKHAGFLGYCCMHRHDHADYVADSHPLQQDIVREIERLSGLRTSELWFGTDGCSAPNIGMPLSRLAMMWARLASGASGGSAKEDAILTEIFAAMTAHPEMVSGTGRCDLAIARATSGDCVGKVGVDGTYVIGVKSVGLGIAIKIADGDLSALYASAVAVLREIGLVDDRNVSVLARWDNPRLRNLRGIEVGQLKTMVHLSRTSG
ncbi:MULTISPECIES: asparaginase [Paraburkholderia]|uniref:L-asparaginase II n=1 Tax=Paraburkholderia bannensis TaxID=765414 RepID=A0A7W9U591_9BURK|nr:MULTISPECIES: asparaginase [Paraburkholderia]MBB3262361.1 L-asparaginase II [Paraburkholderia sp. WP4_3_2]MBB6107254.1 L-asparaginase II [Paraburkholderia bannensis]MCX4156134.1 asparaginase [Paraburkholderia aspalathi]MDN7165540.1 asparaginase [Paraburkholderia sp. SECH2]MDQ6394026.1 asparaginase [Paraburkholderia aspalathi]